MTRRSLIWLALAVLVSAVPVSASTFQHMSRQELVAQADAVVQGRVVAVSEFWNAERTNIVTEAIFEVEQLLIGEASGTIVLRTFGGTVGDYSVEAHGFPEFRTGQRMIVFTKRSADGATEILGYREGQFRLMRDTQGRSLAVPMVEEGMRYLTADGRPAPQPAIMALDTFKSQIRELGLKTGRITN